MYIMNMMETKAMNILPQKIYNDIKTEIASKATARLVQNMTLSEKFNYYTNLYKEAIEKNNNVQL